MTLRTDPTRRRGPTRRVAIVGAGPSGLFAAQSLSARDDSIQIDLIDRMPTPFGLLRYGVAPDHTSIKAVATALVRVFDSGNIRFRGMVELGRDISRQVLLDNYDAVIYAAGANDDQRLGIPGEELPNSRSARLFVDWYSGHPDAREQPLEGIESAMVVGVGNVAIDVARILLKPVEELHPTDMPAPVLAELRDHRVQDVWVVGRRGPQHASFTTKELRELLALPGVQTVVRAQDLDGIDESTLDRRPFSNVQTLREAAAVQIPDPRARLHFAFWSRPIEVLGDQVVTGVRLEGTELCQGRLRGTGEITQIPIDLLLRAVGYRGMPMPGVPFDTRRNVIPNLEGRVLDMAGVRQPQEYCTGWIKRGPFGVIGTNKPCAVETVGHLLDDLATAPAHPGQRDLDEVLEEHGVAYTTLQGWQAIDAGEVTLGTEQGRARTKIHTWQDLLELAHGGFVQHEVHD